MTETVITGIPDWVIEAPAQTLVDIWLARYGTDWVRLQEIEDDYNAVASRLVQIEKMVVHQPAPDVDLVFRLVGLEG